MAEDDQNIGLDGRPVFAGDTLAIDFTIATGGTAAGVSAAEWGLFDRAPVAETVGQLALLPPKTLGAGITVADGAAETVVVSVDVPEGETVNFPGLHYQELRLTVSGETFRVAQGQVWLQHGAL